MADEKKTASFKVHISEALELELRRLADQDGRKLSEFAGHVLKRYVYGNALRVSDDGEPSPEIE